MLGWCAVLNFAVLLWWWGWFVWGHELIYQLHSRWFRLSPERFDSIHYAAMAGYKLAILLLNVFPWVALAIMAK